MADKPDQKNTETRTDAKALFSKPVVVELPYSGTVLRDIPYGSNGQFADIYYPAKRNDPVPLVVFVTGYPDPGFEKMTGLKLKDIVQNQSWARLLAASGIAAILYTAADPVRDALELVDWVTGKAGELGINAQGLGVFSLSGNVPNALHVLQQRHHIRCASLCYGFMLDSEPEKVVSAAAAQFHFVNPNGTQVQFATELALLLVRAGQDAFPGVNESIDNFVGQALQANRDLELINYPQGAHAFDILDDSEHARQLVRRIVKFYQQRLSVFPGST